MENKLAVRDPEKVELWTRRIRECKSSGQSVPDWCQENGYNIKTYYYWHKRIPRLAASEIEPEQTRFYEVSSCPNVGGGVVATLHAGMFSADIYTGADSGTIAAICKALKIC